jgi:hypothetical protein
MIRNLSLLIAAAALALVIATVGWLAVKGGWHQSQTASFPIIEQIKLVAKLQTVEYHGTNTVRKHKASTFGSSTVVYLLEGKVAASVDLEQMQIEPFGSPEERRVRLKLPEVVVDDPVVKRLEVLMSCGSLLAPELTDAERNSVHQEALGRLKLAAEEDGIRAKARKQAEDYLRTFLGALAYTVEFAT